MSTFTYGRNLRGITITLTTANTKYNLWTLLNAVDSTVPQIAGEVVISADLANSTGIVRLGDVNLSTTRCGYQLSVGDSRTYVTRAPGVDVQDIYLMPDTNALKVNVETVNF